MSTKLGLPKEDRYTRVQREIKKLYEKYPLTFQRKVRIEFNVGPGWLPLLDKLCSGIENELNSLPVFLLPEKHKDFGIGQVKEKFGGLRFYLDTVPDEIRDNVYKLIGDAESESYKVCEECSAPGRAQGTGWIRTLCDDCQEKLEQDPHAFR